MKLDREDLLVIIAGEFIVLGVSLVSIPVGLICVGVFIVGFRAASALVGNK